MKIITTFILRWIMLVYALGLFTGCAQVAVMMTPAKKPIASHQPLAQTAENKFWQTLHQGRYDQIDKTAKLLLAAYLKNPNDPALAAHMGFLHIWKLAERNRHVVSSPDIVNEIILAKKYFGDAVLLNSADARSLGFLGDSELVSGQIFKDEKEQVAGYFTLQKARHQWPEFNNFSAGYPMSTLAPTSKYFKEGLDWQWQTLDLCACEKVNRCDPNFRPYMHLETRIGPKRACWNSWIAPYNFEGFFLNMGDMLVKSGDWRSGRKIYRNAKLASNYSSWPYRHLLEHRIIHARENVRYFNQTHRDPYKSIMFNSGYGCMTCHQQGVL